MYKKVSIIIPVYKAEAYLKECIDSVLCQDYPDIEIILIEDGSPDSCPALCDRYAEQFVNISVIHQPNRGPGLSRNAGVKMSSGEYIFFLDSDDCLDGKGAIRLLAKQAEEKRADIAVGSFRRFNDKTVSNVNHHHLHDGPYAQTIDFRFKGFCIYNHLAFNWGKLYRKSFLEDHNLLSGAYPYTEDKAFNMTCCTYEPVYAFIDESVYLYRINSESVTSYYKNDFTKIWVSVAYDFKQFLKTRHIHNRFGDLTAFHLAFGSLFQVQQELEFKRNGIRESVRALKKYGAIPCVRESMSELAKGRYINKIDSFFWKLVIRTTAILMIMRFYRLFACGIALLRKLQFDRRIIESKYKERNY